MIVALSTENASVDSCHVALMTILVLESTDSDSSRRLAFVCLLFLSSAYRNLRRLRAVCAATARHLSLLATRRGLKLAIPVSFRRKFCMSCRIVASHVLIAYFPQELNLLDVLCPSPRLWVVNLTMACHQSFYKAKRRESMNISALLGRPEPPFRTGLCFTRDVFFLSFF